MSGTVSGLASEPYLGGRGETRLRSTLSSMRAGQATAACGARCTGAAGSRPGRWARGLGAWAGYGLCTRPVFDPV